MVCLGRAWADAESQQAALRLQDFQETKSHALWRLSCLAPLDIFSEQIGGSFLSLFWW